MLLKKLILFTKLNTIFKPVKPYPLTRFEVTLFKPGCVIKFWDIKIKKRYILHSLGKLDVVIDRETNEGAKQIISMEVTSELCSPSSPQERTCILQVYLDMFSSQSLDSQVHHS